MATEDVGIRARLIGARQYIRDVNEAARAQARMATTADKVAAATRGATRHTFAYNQAIFTARRLLFGFTVAAGAAATAATLVGLRFDASLQRTNIALEYLSKGQFDATEQTKEFLRIARETSFLPQQVIEIGQSFIAFGFSAEMANRTLRATGIHLALLNAAPATIDRVVFAMGQIQVKGRLMAEEIRQLANANIPVYRYLAEAFGENVTQMNRIGDARIPAAAAIEAIVSGLERDTQGGSKALQKSALFQIEQLKGDIQAILGTMFLGLFGPGAERLQKITAITGKMFEAILDQGAGPMDLVKILDDATGGAYHLVTAAKTLTQFFTELWQTGGMVVRVFKPFLQLALVLAYVLLEATSAVNNFIQLGGTPLVIVLQLLVGWLIAEKIAMVATTVWTRKIIYLAKVHMFWSMRLAFATKLLTFWRRKETGANIASATSTAFAARMKAMDARIAVTSTGANVGLTAATWGLVTSTWAAVAALTAFQIVTGVGVIIAVAALITVFGYLIYKYERFRNIVIELTSIFVPFVSQLRTIYRVLTDIDGTMDRLKDKMSSPKGWLDIGLDRFIPGPLKLAAGGARRLTSLAEGGRVTSGGLFQVHSPEIIGLPTGSAVSPIAGGMGSLLEGLQLIITPAAVNVDGRQLAEITFDHRLDRLARR